jgi:hypothetical protein
MRGCKQVRRGGHNLIRRLIVIASIFALWSVICNSIPVHILDLDALVKDSDVIVVAELTSILDAGRTTVVIGSRETPVRIEDAELRVDRTLKTSGSGEMPPVDRVVVRMYVPEKPVGWPAARLHFYGMYFLKSAKGGKFEFTDPIYPFVPALAQTRMSGGDQTERVLNEVSSFLYASDVPLSGRMAALVYLSHSRSKYATAVLRQALKFQSRELRYIAADKLLERNDISALPIAKTALTDAASIQSDYLLENLSNAIGVGVSDPRAVNDLAQLLAVRSDEVRRNAALALARTRSPGAVSPLLGALRDSDEQVRYYAAVGLAETTGQVDWRPSPEQFRATPGKYLEHWAEWGRQDDQPKPHGQQ